jgi:hypothetical protein
VEAYEVAAAHASRIELRVEHLVVNDNWISNDYGGPQLIVIAHQGKLVTIDELSRQIEPLQPEHMVKLVELALAACDEQQPRGGVDTANSRPLTFFRMHVYRALHEREVSRTIVINHYASFSLGPVVSRFLAALRAASLHLPATAQMGWDLAATWMAPVELGDLFQIGRAVPLPEIVQTFTQEGTVYFRSGQPPQRSELYRLDGDGVVWIRDSDELALTCIEGHRWILPCGAGVIETHQAWQQPRRIYVRITDPIRGIYVQRD